MERSGETVGYGRVTSDSWNVYREYEFQFEKKKKLIYRMVKISIIIGSNSNLVMKVSNLI